VYAAEYWHCSITVDIDEHCVQPGRLLLTHDVRYAAIRVGPHKEINRTRRISGGIVDARFYDSDVMRMTHDDLLHFDPISASMFDPDCLLVGQYQAF